MRQATAVQPRLGSCADVDKVAADIRAEQSGSLGKLRVQDLPRALATVVAQLPTNQASDPVRGPSGIHLLMVCDRDTPPQTIAAADPAPVPEPLPSPQLGPAAAPPTGLETRQQVRARLVEEQSQRLANRYLRELRRNAFIDLRS
jgi:peptidyl-prolyl cis-trans isomerase SurA